MLLWIVWTVSAAQGASLFRSVVTFGDSLTHNDVLGIAYDNPQSLYGRDPMEAFFDRAASGGDELASFAVAGSKAGNLKAQLAAYAAAVELDLVRKGSLFSIEIGGNDLMDEIHRLARNPPRVSPATDRIINRIVNSMRSASAFLRKTHPQARILLWTLPDVTRIPKFWDEFSPQQQENIRAHILRGNRAIRRLAADSRVIILDLHEVLRRTTETPPILLGRPLLPPPAWGEYDCVFADPIHPTAVANALIANEAVQTIRTAWGLTIPLFNERQLARMAHIRSALAPTDSPLLHYETSRPAAITGELLPWSLDYGPPTPSSRGEDDTRTAGPAGKRADLRLKSRPDYVRCVLTPGDIGAVSALKNPEGRSGRTGV